MSGPVRRPLRVLVVDDSAVVRETIVALLARESDLAVVTAADPLIALQKMERGRPDVILLDLLMPRMDGLTFLRKLMAEDPIPAVVCSGLGSEGADLAFRALDEGAVEVIAKPRLGTRQFLEESAATIVGALRAAAQARLRPRGGAASPRLSADAVLPPPARRLVARRAIARPTTRTVIAVGASTGGTEALRVFLEAMPEDSPGIVAVVHMPEAYTGSFAERLDRGCRIEVREAAAGDRLLEGRALIARGNRHLALRRAGAAYKVEVIDGPLVSRHRPSVDVLFRSVAGAAGPDAVGVLMTGMGDDGAAGLLEMQRAGAATIAQDEATSVVFGMPREAIERGAADQVLPLPRIAAAVLRLAEGKAAGSEGACGS